MPVLLGLRASGGVRTPRWLGFPCHDGLATGAYTDVQAERRLEEVTVERHLFLLRHRVAQGNGCDVPLVERDHVPDFPLYRTFP